jgi:DNA-binding transcriptional LysR family regulator
LHIDLITVTSPSSVSQREVDIFVGSSVPIEGRIISRKLTDYHAGLFASQSYLERRPPIATTSDVFSDDYISDIDAMYSPHCELTLVPRVQFRSTNVLPLLQAVKQGQAIAILPSYVARQDEALVPILPVQINFRHSLYALLHEDNKNLARVRTVSDFIFSEVRKYRSLFLTEAFASSKHGLTSGPIAIS